VAVEISEVEKAPVEGVKMKVPLEAGAFITQEVLSVLVLRYPVILESSSISNPTEEPELTDPPLFKRKDFPLVLIPPDKFQEVPLN
jgi:hypothetical protein